jgi:hypothetical protein
LGRYEVVGRLLIVDGIKRPVGVPVAGINQHPEPLIRQPVCLAICQICTNIEGGIAANPLPARNGDCPDIGAKSKSSAHGQSDANDRPKADVETSLFRKYRQGFQELPLLRAYCLLSPQKLKEIAHATCSGRAKIPDQLACNDCGERFSRLPSIIAADAVFRSPVGLKPYPGRELVCLMLSTAARIFEDFKYHRKFLNDENAALEFSAHIGDIELKAIHLIRFNAAANSWRSRNWCAQWKALRRSVMRWVRQSGRK